MNTTTSPVASSPVGELLRGWRRRRRLSQLDLALAAEVSQRHLSFLESGRAAPSREMVLRLAEPLAIPLRERNALLAAAGFAPVYPERALDDPDLAAARRAVEQILEGHLPHPALAVDRRWHLVFANKAVAPLMAGADEKLLAPPVNVLRLSLHPDGLAPRIGNFRQWRAHILERLGQQIDASGDAGLVELLEELKGYPVPPGARPYRPAAEESLGGIAVPLEYVTDKGTLRFLSTTTVFGTALDISLSELAIETFFPADAGTAQAMRALAEGAD
ncbi:MmyB family transcriptional regulator [Pelagibius marinus]|uniref:MmyB family transcriptional regulator n=1 Tax=Pelagibius marinus TaxID=2762760 RepID=UPI001872C970|nr:helix-turn-helix domain-containing protein [Pelagibius marinus]